MKLTLLLPLLVLACLAVIYITFLGGTLLTTVAETQRPVVQAVKPLYVPVSNIDPSSVSLTLVTEATVWCPAPLEYAPALPAPPMGNSRIRRDSF